MNRIDNKNKIENKTKTGNTIENKTGNITGNARRTQNIYLNWLYHIPGIGRKRIGSILDGGQNPHWLYVGKRDEVEKYLRKVYVEKGIHEGFAVSDMKRIMEARKLHSPEKMYEDLGKKKIQFICREDKEYPARLKLIPDPPVVLYRMGKGKEEKSVAETPEEIRRPVVAVVGARNCSEYGRAMAKRIGELCGEMGIGLVSGLASGVDGISQWWALQSGGEVTAVLGCGVDVCYPWENKRIYTALLHEGEIYSEYIPGTEPKSQNFPPRNRIISGLSDAVIVVEAKEKSGTLITVDMALEQGKDVYVVPGRITDSLSAGCNRLISQGAEMIVDPEKTLTDIAFAVKQKESDGLHNLCKYKCKGDEAGGTAYNTENNAVNNAANNPAEGPEPPGGTILRALDLTPRTVQEIYEKIKENSRGELPWNSGKEMPGDERIKLQYLQQKLLLLEMGGTICEKGGRFYRKY